VALTREVCFLTILERSGDQRISGVGLLQDLSPWPVDGHLFQVSLYYILSACIYTSYEDISHI
jgi:hypothetical protein